MQIILSGSEKSIKSLLDFQAQYKLTDSQLLDAIAKGTTDGPAFICDKCKKMTPYSVSKDLGDCIFCGENDWGVPVEIEDYGEIEERAQRAEKKLQRISAEVLR